MKIYLDKNNQLTGYEMTFFDPKKKRPKTDLKTGKEAKSAYLNEKQNRFIQRYIEKGGKITDLKFNGRLIENKIKNKPFVCGFDKYKTIIIDVEKFRADSDLSRHLKDSEKYTIEELENIPIDKIDKKYLYYSDNFIIEKESQGGIPASGKKRFFALFNENKDLSAFSFIIFKPMPILLVLYHDERFNNAGYILINKIVEKLKDEKIKYFDLGGLTGKESGINQFKRKFGKEIFVKDRFLYENSL